MNIIFCKDNDNKPLNNSASAQNTKNESLNDHQDKTQNPSIPKTNNKKTSDQDNRGNTGKPPIDDDEEYFSGLLKNNQDESDDRRPEVDTESILNYVDNLDESEQQAFIETFLANNKDNAANINTKDLKLTEKDIENMDIQKVLSYLSKFHKKTAYNEIQKTLIPLDQEMIKNLKAQSATSSQELSKIKPLRTETFNIKDSNHVRFLKKIELSGRINRHNPPSNKTFLDKAENTGIDGSYYVCYNEDNNIIGVFSIYNASGGLGDAYSFFMALDESATGKGYGTSIVLSALIQIASLSSQKLIECRSVHALVEEQNTGSMKIMQKLVKIGNNGNTVDQLFSKYNSRSLNSCKFDLTKIYESSTTNLPA